MTTQQVRDAFRSGLSAFIPARSRQSFALYREAVEAHRRADDIWGAWWRNNDVDRVRETVIHQATDLLLCLSGRCALESARLAVMNAADIDS